MSALRLFLIALVCLMMVAAAAQSPDATPEITPEATIEPTAEATREPFTDVTEAWNVWQAVGLTIRTPNNWQVSTSVDGTRSRHELVFRSNDEQLIYIVLDETFTDAALYDALDAEMRGRGIALSSYLQAFYFGRIGWLIDGLIGTLGVSGTIARLPDDRTLMRIVIIDPNNLRTISLADSVRFGLFSTGANTGTSPANAYTLTANMPVQRQLGADNTQQVWTYTGAAGETITLSAVDLGRTVPSDIGLDMAIRVLAPDGSEMAYNDDQPGADLFGVYDAHISNLILPTDGVYQIAVEWVQGFGVYTLGLNVVQPLTLDADGTTEIGGEWQTRLQDAIPYQGYAITARAGQTFTITMTAESGNLDPALELLNPDGSTLLYNDDALNLELGTTAQIVNLTIPADGVYVLEASRYGRSSGRYRVVIVETSR